MSVLDSVRPFWPLLFTFVLPRALGYFKALKTAYRTRPPPSALPPKVDRSLNILFCSILFFFIQSIPRGPDKDLQNVFSTTNTRLGVPNDILFTRLAMLRPNNDLTGTDEALRAALNTKESRLIYLTHGLSALLNCPFCHPSQPQTYVLYSIPTTVFLPHIIHLIVLGIATSGPMTSSLTAKLRTRFVLTSLGLLAIDLFLNTVYAPYPGLIKPSVPSPTSLYTLLSTLRPLAICLLDALFAFYIWTTTTNRFLFLPFLGNPDAASNTSVESLQLQTQELVRTNGVTMQNIQAKLRAYSIARNTVLRDSGLKYAEDVYWREVTRREAEIAGDNVGPEGEIDEIYQDAEVQAAIAQVCGSGGMNIPQARREADAFVNSITRGLDEHAGG